MFASKRDVACEFPCMNLFLLVGPPFGGLFYAVGGKGLPFFILAGIIFVTFGLYNSLLSCILYSLYHLIV